MKRPGAFEVRVAGLLGVSILIIVGIGYLAYNSLNRIVTSVREEARPDLRLLKVKELLSDLDEARNSVSAYSITNDTAYLRPYYRAISSVDGKLSEVRKLPGGDSIGSILIDSIEEIIGQKFLVLDEVLALKGDDRVEAALLRLVARLQPNRAVTVEPPPETENPTTLTEEEPQVIAEPVEESAEVAEPKRPGILQRVFTRKKGKHEEVAITDEDAVDPPLIIRPEPLILPEEPRQPQSTATVTPDVSRVIANVKKEEASRQAPIKEQELLLTARYQSLGDSMTVLITAFEDNERASLQAKTEEADLLAKKTSQQITAFAVAVVLLLLLAFWVIITNIRRLRSYNRVLSKARTRAENLAKAKQEFLSNMSHELRTPLHAITGFSDRLLEEKLSPAQSEAVQTINKAAGHLGGIINDILDLSKLEAGKLVLEQGPVEIRELLKEVGTWLTPTAEAKKIALKISCDDSVPRKVNSDPMRLRQILLNVAGNAVKFTEEGYVSIAATREEQGLHFTISDTGIGIPPEKLKDVFEGFTQADVSTSRKYGGSGLGLAITRRLVELMGGSISVESISGEGSIFRISLPSIETPLRAEEETELPVGFNLSKLSVIAVDDEPFNRKLLESMLGTEVRQLTVFASASEVIKELEHNTYDVLLLDLRMPGMSGSELVESLKEVKIALPPAVLALTAVTDRTELEKCHKAGIHHFLPKPFTKRGLVHHIAALWRELNKPARPVNGINGYSLEELYRVSNGDEDFVHEMVELFVKTTEDGLKEMQEAALKQDWLKVRDTAHRLAPPCAHMKADTLCNLMRRIETLASNGQDESKIRSLLAEVTAESKPLFDRLLSTIHRTQTT